jgi:hypothetical protein
MDSYKYLKLCTKCHGYIGDRITWNSTIPPKMCTCISETHPYGWECPKCNKINAPWKESCDCTPHLTSEDCEAKV